MHLINNKCRYNRINKLRMYQDGEFRSNNETYVISTKAIMFSKVLRNN